MATMSRARVHRLVVRAEPELDDKWYKVCMCARVCAWMAALRGRALSFGGWGGAGRGGADESFNVLKLRRCAAAAQDEGGREKCMTVQVRRRRAARVRSGCIRARRRRRRRRGLQVDLLDGNGTPVVDRRLELRTELVYGDGVTLVSKQVCAHTGL